MRTAAKSKPPTDSGTADPATRERIVAGARRHFFAHGFRGVTMDDLAVELRMSKKTMYVHFASKTALLEAVLQNKLARAEAAFQATMAGGEFAQQLQAMLTCVREQTDEIQPPFLRDMQREATNLFAMVQTGRTRLIQRYFGQLLTAGQKAGRIRKDIRVDLLIDILIGAVNEAINPTRMTELGMTPKMGFAKVIDVFLNGVATQDRRSK
jgi:AcrR family transcriptional regulator